MVTVRDLPVGAEPAKRAAELIDDPDVALRIHENLGRLIEARRIGRAIRGAANAGRLPAFLAGERFTGDSRHEPIGADLHDRVFVGLHQSAIGSQREVLRIEMRAAVRRFAFRIWRLAIGIGAPRMKRGDGAVGRDSPIASSKSMHSLIEAGASADDYAAVSGRHQAYHLREEHLAGVHVGIGNGDRTARRVREFPAEHDRQRRLPGRLRHSGRQGKGHIRLLGITIAPGVLNG